MIAARKLNLNGRVVRSPNKQIPKQLLTAGCNNLWPVGRVLTTNKSMIVKSLKMILPETITK